MTIQDLGSIGEFIASIGVIISLIYLAYQIRQSTQQQRRSEMNEAMHAATAFRSAMLHPEVSEVVYKLLSDPAGLTDEERFRTGHFLDQIFWYGYQSWDRENLKLSPHNSWTDGTKPMIVAMKSNVEVYRWWRRNKYQFPQEFAAEIDEVFTGSIDQTARTKTRSP